MLFAQIIAFILVMVVFEAYRPAPATLSWFESITACLVAAFWLWLGVRMAVAFFLSRLSSGRAPADPATAARALIFKAHGAAVICILFMITMLDLKAHLLTFDTLASSETLLGLSAVIIYFLLSILVWMEVYPLEKRALHINLDRMDYVLGQARFVAPVAFPWFMVVLLRDLWSLVIPEGRAWLNTVAGDLVFLVVFLFIMAAFFPPMVRTWWGCRDWPQGPVRELSEAVLARAGVKVAAILSWPIMQGRLLTAGVLGVFTRFRYLLLTPALTRELSPSELAGVVAHEAGHVHHKHLNYYLLFFLGYFLAAYALSGPIYLLLNLIVYALSGSDWGVRLLSDSGPGEAALSVLTALPLVLLMVIYLRYIMGFFMRNFERQADFFALRFMGSAAPLTQALEKVALLSGDIRQAPSWHHFSIAQRVDALREAEYDPRRIIAHEAKLKKAFKFYLVCLVAVSVTGWSITAWDPGQYFRNASIMRLLEQKIPQAPHDHRLVMTLGILQFEAGKEKEAQVLLHKAWRMAPEDPEVLNSLAWFYATAKEKTLRRPKQALKLALAAISLAPQPHIWDTLAESYFVNGMPEKALAAAQSALAAGPTERKQYYEDQLRRFREAVEKKQPNP